MGLSGKLAFITGGGGGIGPGMAEAFVEKGMRVVLADIDPARAQAVAAALAFAAFSCSHAISLAGSGEAS